MKEQFIKIRQVLQSIEETLTNMIAYKEKNSFEFFQNLTKIEKLKSIRYAIHAAIECTNKILINYNNNNKIDKEISCSY